MLQMFIPAYGVCCWAMKISRLLSFCDLHVCACLHVIYSTFMDIDKIQNVSQHVLHSRGAEGEAGKFRVLI